jgi:hypothetical protein
LTGVALSYVIDSDRRLLTITGEYADAVEWNRLLTAVLDDPALRPGFAFLRDLRGATNPVEPATVVGIVDVVRRFWPKLQATRAAILTPRDVDPAALVAHALADAQHLPLQVFRTYEEAIAWLNETTDSGSVDKSTRAEGA